MKLSVECPQTKLLAAAHQGGSMGRSNQGPPSAMPTIGHPAIAPPRTSYQTSESEEQSFNKAKAATLRQAWGGAG